MRKKRLSNYCIMIGYWQGNSRFGRRKIADSKNVKIFRIEKVVLREICRRSKFGLLDSPINRNGLRYIAGPKWIKIDFSNLKF